MKKSIHILILLSMIFLSCNVSPVDIQYDYDQCHACKMTISDSRFGCEYVTTKGKIFKYDAIECLVRDINKLDKADIAYTMVTHFDTPKKLKPAEESYFFISKDRPSPMGAFLSAYESRSAVDQLSQELNGQVFNWQELLKYEIFN